MNEAEEEVDSEYLANHICGKNPGHSTFIPMSAMSKTTLPLEARHDVIIQILKDTAARTVKLTVYHTADRPRKFHVGVAAHSRQGRLATGWVELFDQTMDKLPGYRPGHTFVISTAAHVVFDKKEAKRTKVDFFYNVDGDRSNVVTAWGVSLILVNTALDVCRFMCQTENQESGRRIIQNLRSVRLSYPPLPPLKNIAWCISHPHGFSKRLTIGRVTKVVEYKSGWRCNLLKILVFKCCLKKQFHEKKVFFMFFRDSSHGIDKLITKNVSVREKLEQKEQYINHLLSNNLVEIPTSLEYSTLQDEYSQLLDTINNEGHALIKQQPNISIEQIPLHSDHHQFLFQEVINKMALQTPTTANFQNLWDSIEKSLFAKKHEILYGIKPQHGDLSRIKHIVYDLDSCPGSSGARVTAYVRTPLGCRRFMGFHSRGLDGCQGNMCGGGGSRIVPTLPIDSPQSSRGHSHGASTSRPRWSASDHSS